MIPPSSFQTVWKWAKLEGSRLPAIEEILFLDTETSGLAGGTGTFAFMIGLGSFQSDGFEVTQLFMRDPSEEQALLAVLARLTTKYSTVVTYNGKSFDLPLLRSRHIQNRFPINSINWMHIDLLHLVRQVWKYSQKSRTLKDMEVNVLQYQRSQDEVPGWLVPQLYFEYLQTRNPQPLVGVFYHNAVDIVSLAALFCLASEILENPFRIKSEFTKNTDAIALARIFENLSVPEIASVLYSNGIKNGLPAELEISSLLRYAELCKRNQHIADALSLWTEAAQNGSLEACVEIAKHYEHNERDYTRALEFTLLAQTNIPKNAIYSTRRLMSELTSRLMRLQKKISECGQQGKNRCQVMMQSDGITGTHLNRITIPNPHTPC